MDSQNLIQYTIDDIGGEVVKDNETYLLKDNKTLNNLVLSSTLLNPFKQTTGHNHSGQEEVYFFVNGTGYMTVDEEKIDVKPGTVVLILMVLFIEFIMILQNLYISFVYLMVKETTNEI